MTSTAANDDRPPVSLGSAFEEVLCACIRAQSQSLALLGTIAGWQIQYLGALVGAWAPRPPPAAGSPEVEGAPDRFEAFMASSLFDLGFLLGLRGGERPFPE